MQTLRKERIESRNDCTLQKIDHLMECWEQRFTLNNPRFIERYKKHEAHILVEFCLRGCVGIKYVAGLTYSGISYSNGGEVDAFHERHCMNHRFKDWPSDVMGMGTPRNDKPAVFVDIVKSVDEPESIIPSLIWLGPVDSIYGRLRHSLYMSVFSHCVVRGGLLKNRELDVLEGVGSPCPVLVERADTIGIFEDELEGNMIERTPEVLNHISDCCGYRFINFGDANEVIM